MTLTIGSMFSGVGGLDLGISKVFDATPAWFCEFDDAPSRILAHHWPDVPNHRDVTQIDWEELAGGDATDSHRIDILTGGYP